MSLLCDFTAEYVDIMSKKIDASVFVQRVIITAHKANDQQLKSQLLSPNFTRQIFNNQDVVEEWARILPRIADLAQWQWDNEKDSASLQLLESLTREGDLKENLEHLPPVIGERRVETFQKARIFNLPMPEFEIAFD